jgi:2-dehydro-3-deoxygluconokinase
LADIVIASQEELPLVASGGEDDAVHHLLNGGARTVLIKRGVDGASLYDVEGRLDLPAVPVSVVDPVGAGDAFVAGYLSGLLDGLEPIQCLDRAVRLGAFAVGALGDSAGLPTRGELGLLDDLHVTTQR